MNNKKIALATFLAVALSGWLSTAQAIIILDTGAPLNGGLSGPALTIDGGGFFSPAQYIAGRFTTTQDYEITELAAFVRGAGCCGTTDYSFQLGLAFGPDLPSNSQLTSLFALPTTYVGSNTTAGWASVAVDNYLLTPGTWWIVASATPGQFSPALSMGVPNPLDAYAFSSGNSWNVLNAASTGTPDFAPGFRVTGNARGVPEPDALALLLAGVAGVALARRRGVARVGRTA